jgi:hypothetical protein
MRGEKKIEFFSQLDLSATLLEIDFQEFLKIFSINFKSEGLKIVSHKSWHLDIKTKTQIYKSLIRSLIEFSAILYNTLNKKLKTILNTVQYNALRIIHGKDRSFSNKNLFELAEIEPLEERMLKLKNNYVNTALNNKNPIVCEVVESYKKFKYYGRTIKNLKKTTTMCDVTIV